MKQAAEAVIEFNRDLLGTPTRPICPMPVNEYEHLKKALREELGEFMVAWTEEDVVEMVDALLDMIYFGIGGLYKMGLTADQIHACFMAVHMANMTKRRGIIASRHVDGVPDAEKPADFIAADVEITKILGLAGE